MKHTGQKPAKAKRRTTQGRARVGRIGERLTVTARENRGRTGFAERGRMEERLREWEERYRSLYENSTDAILLTATDGRIFAANPEACRMFQRSEDELRRVGRNGVVDLNDPRLTVALQERARTGRFRGELNHKRKDGSVFPAEVATNVFKVGDEPKATAMIIRDLTERKQLEDELRKSTQFLESVIESASVWMDAIDPEGNVLLWNKAAESISGYSREEVIGHRNIWQWLYPDEKYRKRIADMLPGPQEENEATIRRKDGEMRTVAWSERRLIAKNDEVLGAIIIGRDITDQKRMKDQLKHYAEHLERMVEERTEKLAESEARYRRLFESSPISLWEEDFSEVKRYLDMLRIKGCMDLREHFKEHPKDIAKCAEMVKVLNINEATLKLYDAKTLDELRRELTRVFTNEFRDNFRDGLAALAQGEMRFASEFDTQTLVDDAKHVSLILNVVPGYEKTLARVLVSVIDLTPKDKLEKELRSARDQLEHVLATTPGVLYFEEPLSDFSDTISTFVSESARSVLGFEPKKFLGKAGLSFWRSRIQPDDLLRYWTELPSLWKDGQYTFEYRFLHADGNYRWITEQYRAIRDAQGRISSVVAVAVDITDRKQLEEKLATAERLATIGQTAAMVAHDLRNPLQGIAGAAYLLRHEALTANEHNEMIQQIENCVEYSDGIVKDLLDYARPLELAWADTTPKELATKAIALMQIPNKIKVRDQSEDRPKISVDLDRMKRVFVNLIENAVDAMPDGGALTITSKESNGVVQVEFSDTGRGLPVEILDNLWKPLQTTKAKGMGLGLAIVKRIVEAHNGEVSVESKTGVGTTYILRLPVRSNRASE